jgi:pSer/pThr/pTyr-binding forkhead associated (FHA) protein
VRGDDGWTVRDLGSRNGTFLNDEQIEAESPLQAGDELRVGPLKFLVEASKPRDKTKSKKEKQADKPDKPAKQPPVKDVADAVQRTAAKSDDSATEEDISRWLLGVSDADAEESLKETRTIRMEETGAIEKAARRSQKPETTNEHEDPNPADSNVDADVMEEADEAEDTDGDAKKSGAWGWLKFGKGRQKKKPGKLPPRAGDADTKDSREAAAEILREMTRRH